MEAEIVRYLGIIRGDVDAIGGVFASIGGTIQGIIDGPMSGWQWWLDQINLTILRIKGNLSTVPGFAGTGFTGGGIVPGSGSGGGGTSFNAEGTSFFPGGLGVVGERGPELMAPPRGSRIWSGADSRTITREVTEMFNLTVNTSAPREPIMSDFELMRARARRR
jgi:hypothetical protein